MGYQLASPGDHQVNLAEHAIGDFKNHFITTLAGVHPEFPANCWDLLLPQVEITLNLLRVSKVQPKLSAYALLHWSFDFNQTPMAPAGSKIVIHNRAPERPTWAEHGTHGFYIGPAMNHYRNYECYIPSTKATRISNSVAFFPHCCELPATSSTDCLTMSLKDVTTALQNPHPPTPFLDYGTGPHAALRDLHDIVGTILSNPDVPPRVERRKEEIKKRATHRAPKTETAQPPRVSSTVRSTRTNHIYGPGTKIRKKFSDGKYYEGEVTRYDDIKGYYRIKYEDGDTEDLDRTEMNRYYKFHQQHSAMATGGTVWDATLNKMCAYRDLIKHPEPLIRNRWLKAGENEFGRLFQGFKPNTIEGVEVFEWVKYDEVPCEKTATYPRFTVADRPEKTERYRCRITASGDRLSYDGEVSTKTSSLETFKCLLNSVVSSPGAKMFTGDISTTSDQGPIWDQQNQGTWIRLRKNQQSMVWPKTIRQNSC